MHQQINLYQPVFRKELKVLSSTTLLQVTGVVLLLIIASYSFFQWQLVHLQRTLSSLQAQHDSLQDQLTAIEGTADGQDLAALDQHIATLDTQRAQTLFALEKLSSLMSERSQGFSGFFKTLAEQQIPGLWLTAIHIEGGQGIEIRGSTYDAGLVPSYLQQLPGTLKFASTHFSQVELRINENNQQQLDFLLKSQEAVMGKDADPISNYKASAENNLYSPINRL